MPRKAKKTAAALRKTTRASSTEEVKDEVRADVSDASGDVNDNRKSSAEQNIGVDGPASLKKEEEVKEDENEIGERLEYLEEDEPEYESEEDTGHYDEMEGDQIDLQEEGDDDVEELEEGDLDEEGEGNLDEEGEGDLAEEEEEGDLAEEEEEGDLYEEDMEDVPEEVEGEENNELAESVDAAEEQEHREIVRERRKRKEFEIFVGGLDKDATEEDLKEIFNAVGEVTEVRLMINSQTKKNKGFAFLRFATVGQAKRAVKELKNPVVKGKQCGVTPSQDSDTLFLGNVCKTWTKEKLKEKLEHYGIENVESLTLMEDSNNEGTNRGFAFLDFPSRSDAMEAFKRLQKRDILLGVDRPAKVSFADSFIDPEDEIMAKVKTVFVDGLLSSWDEDCVRNLLKKFGEIEKIELARNIPSARRKDYGFVTFDSHDVAVTCATSINNTELGEGDHKAKVRARLSRPLQWSKAKNHSRSDYRGGRAAGRLRAPWTRPQPRPFPAQVRGFGSRFPAAVDRFLPRPYGLRGRRPLPPMTARARPFPPLPRSYGRKAPVLPLPKSSLKRDYPKREGLPPRRGAAVDYGSRMPPERHPSYREEYAAYPPLYSNLHRSGMSRPPTKRPYADGSYGSRYERPPPTYREGLDHDYETISGSKRPYSSMYVDPGQGARHSRSRLDYDVPGGASHYGDLHSDRMGRAAVGHSTSSSRSRIPAQDSQGLYHNRQGMSYRGSYSGSDVSGMYSSSFGGENHSRRSDVGGNSYSSLYSSRSMGGSSYNGGSSSGSYY